MRHIEAPHPYHRQPADGPAIFLAGGITGCPDWQREARALVHDEPVVLLNPRRERYDPTGTTYTVAEQVAWEYRHLQLADLTLFWFPACDARVTVAPIALLELGTAIAEARLNGRRITVGADPRYPRRIDLELQLAHALPMLTVYSSLPQTVAVALRALNERF